LSVFSWRQTILRGVVPYQLCLLCADGDWAFSSMRVRSVTPSPAPFSTSARVPPKAERDQHLGDEEHRPDEGLEDVVGERRPPPLGTAPCPLTRQVF
jgi:hypothetical protein